MSSSALQVLEPRQISFVSSAQFNASRHTRRILPNFTISSITQPSSTPFYSFEHIFSLVRVKWQFFEFLSIRRD